LDALSAAQVKNLPAPFVAALTDAQEAAIKSRALLGSFTEALGETPGPQCF
jgi:hypothetical protein